MDDLAYEFIRLSAKFSQNSFKCLEILISTVLVIPFATILILELLGSISGWSIDFIFVGVGVWCLWVFSLHDTSFSVFIILNTKKR